jgi:hypothetical protein
MRPLQKNAADPQQSRDAKRDAKRRRDMELADMRALLTIPGARRVLRRIVDHCRPHQSMIPRGLVTDSHLLFHEAGFHDAGIFIMSEIRDADPMVWAQMEQEAALRFVADLAQATKSLNETRPDPANGSDSESED